MSTSALPFNAAGGARPGGGPVGAGVISSTEDMGNAMTKARTGLFCIAILSVTIIVVIIMNLLWGAGEPPSSSASGSAGTSNNLVTDKKNKSYPNQMRDYIVLAGAVLILIASLPSIYNTYPKRG